MREAFYKMLFAYSISCNKFLLSVKHSSIPRYSVKSCHEKFLKLSRKSPVMEALFGNLEGENSQVY